ncbi:hypothetical protein FQR65_LT07114 [Abscondita terminalis]|nr:hypothetical protein FQR65_LT07114 [Abscondita terminalis]
MLMSRVVVFTVCLYLSYAQVTIKKNPLLSRKRRYLLFPEGSNFVMTLSVVKSIMVKAPRLHNFLGECDVPFKLPSDPQMLREHKFHKQKREIYSQLEDALSQYGINGNACVKRMICDAKIYLPEKGQSLVADVLATVFISSITDPDEEPNCDHSVYDNCQVPFLQYIMGSLMPQG